MRVGRALHKDLKPSQVQKLKEGFVEEKGSIESEAKHGLIWHDATGEDCQCGLVEAYAKSMTKIYDDPGDIILQDVYDKMNDVFNPFLSQDQAKKGRHTNIFLDGTGREFAWQL